MDIAQEIGDCLMYADAENDQQVGRLQICAAPPYRKNSDLHRLWSWFRYFLGALWIVWRTPSRSLLFIVAQPPYLPILGWLRNVLTGQRYVVWVDDIYPDLLIRLGRLSDGHIATRVWRWFNRLMLSRADRVFTLGPCMAEVLRQYLPGNDDDRLMIVPTWVDPQAIRPLPKEENPFAIQHGQVGKLTVLYSGNLGLSHDLGTMVEAAKRLQDRGDIHFMIIGVGARWVEIEKAASKLPNLTLLPYQPEEVLPFSLATADVAVISLDHGFEGVSMPSKTYYMMAAGAAILWLSKPPSDLQMVIEQYQCGVNVKPGDVDGFVGAVLRFRDNIGLLNQSRTAARQAVVCDFSRQVNTRRIQQILAPLLAKSLGTAEQG